MPVQAEVVRDPSLGRQPVHPHEDAAEGYRAMDERRAIKTLLNV
jgi:hypothetical protein